MPAANPQAPLQTTRTLKPTDLALDRRLQLAIARDDDLAAEALDPEVGVGGAAPFGDSRATSARRSSGSARKAGSTARVVMEPSSSVYV